jgi:hypothetical protein
METLGNKKVAKVAFSNNELFCDDNKSNIIKNNNKNALLTQCQETNGNEKLQKVAKNVCYDGLNDNMVTSEKYYVENNKASQFQETFGNKKLQKVANFICNFCNYSTNRKSSFTKHISSSKHSNIENNLNNISNNCISNNCIFCNKIFLSRSGLWKHKKICQEIKNENNIIEQSELQFNKDMFMAIMKENSELKNMMIKVLENGIYNNNTNCNNKTFNLNMFLNETCKNAMNISDFMHSIQLQLSDLEDVGELGYINGISNIIIKNLKELDITQRPIHCTDAKREIIYVKDKDKWEKDGEQNEIMVGFVKNVANKNIRMLNEFKKKYPDCCKYESKYSDYYSKLIIEAMGGSGGSDDDKHAKIIKKICKEIIIDKNVVL